MNNTIEHIALQPMAIELINYTLPSEIITSVTGHATLWQLYAELSVHQNRLVRFDCTSLSMIHGNMCALFILLIESLRTNNALTFRLINCKAEHYDFFTRNGLLSHVHEVPCSYDNRKSVVPAKLFNPQSDSDSFCHYIENDLLGHRGLDKLPEEGKSWLKVGFEETFANVAEHSNTNLLATCGQLFPKNNQFHFTICDMGEGFYKKIAAYTKKKGIPIATIPEAIGWSLNGNSTREDEYCTEGGVALKKLITHCEQNIRCSFSLVTDNHNWQIVNGKSNCQPLPFITKGTTIHLIFT